MATSIFQSTLPAREATLPPALRCLWSTNFNPRFPRGKRPPFGSLSSSQTEFQSTLPAREATQRDPNIPHRFAISIHASREGSDIGKDTKSIDGFNFNPRFPRGKRHKLHRKLHPKTEFQSTLPAREATKAGRRFISPEIFQSTLPAREATPQLQSSRLAPGNFNPRFPRGKRLHSYRLWVLIKNFNPRFPRGKRPKYFTIISDSLKISIHASREGSDNQAFFSLLHSRIISIHASRGGSDEKAHQMMMDWRISIHASRGGSDLPASVCIAQAAIISIHASRGGSDKGRKVTGRRR